MALPALDTFTGSASDPLSGNWTADHQSCLINGSNQCVGVAADHNIIRWTGDTFPDDQYVQANVYFTSAQASGVTARAAGTGGGQGYLLSIYDPGSGGGLDLQKFSGGGTSFTVIASFGAGVSGDLLRLEAVGDALEAFQNGVSLGTNNDSTYTTGAAGSDLYQSARLDNFQAGAMSGGGGGTTTIYMLSLLGVGGSIAVSGGGGGGTTGFFFPARYYPGRYFPPRYFNEG